MTRKVRYPLCPFDSRVDKKEENCKNYSELKYEIEKFENGKGSTGKGSTGKVIQVITIALGKVTKHFEKWIEKLDLDLTSEALHKLCLLGTTRIIRKVLDI